METLQAANPMKKGGDIYVVTPDNEFHLIPDGTTIKPSDRFLLGFSISSPQRYIIQTFRPVLRLRLSPPKDASGWWFITLTDGQCALASKFDTVVEEYENPTPEQIALKRAAKWWRSVLLKGDISLPEALN